MVGDAARLRQVIFNLVGNAIKFTETGGVSIIVEPAARPDEIVIAVRDTGIGIAPEDQTRVFLEFEQADSGPTRKFDGIGVGLTISKRIVERMGGSIAIDSVAGQGSTFRVTVTLPRAGDADEPPVAVPDLAGNDILIVAPAVVEASLLARRLQRWGARTTIVPDEAVATALLPEQPWSAVLVDHALGSEASAALARIAAKMPRRIVLVTPAMRNELAALKQAGFTGYLIKPVRAVSLAARFAPDDAFDHGTGRRARRNAERCAGRRQPFGSGRRGQRDQRAAGAHASGEARPPPDHGRQRRRRRGVLARRARRRRRRSTAC